MAWIVEHLVPPGVEVERATTLDEVQTILREHPPQAALFNVRSASRPWRDVGRMCREHQPPIPILCHPWTYVGPAEVGIPEDAGSFCPKPLPAGELQRRILELIAAAGNGESFADAAEKSPIVARATV